MIATTQFGGVETGATGYVAHGITTSTPGCLGLYIFGQPIWIQYISQNVHHSFIAVNGVARIVNKHGLPESHVITVGGRAAIKRKQTT